MLLNPFTVLLNDNDVRPNTAELVSIMYTYLLYIIRHYNHLNTDNLITGHILLSSVSLPLNYGNVGTNTPGMLSVA